MALLRSAALAALIVLAATLAAFAHKGVIHTGCPAGQTFTAGDVTVTGAWLRATPKGAKSAAAYLVVSNTGAAPDTLIGATSEAASDISLHSMTMDGNMMKMAPVEGGLEVPAGGSVALSPMGFHVMMTGMEQPFVEGQCVEMTLHFATAGDIKIELNIGSLTQDGPPTGDASAPSMPMDHDMSGMDMGSSSMAM